MKSSLPTGQEGMTITSQSGMIIKHAKFLPDKTGQVMTV